MGFVIMDLPASFMTVTGSSCYRGYLAFELDQADGRYCHCGRVRPAGNERYYTIEASARFKVVRNVELKSPSLGQVRMNEMKSGETKELGDGESEIPPTKLMLLDFLVWGGAKTLPNPSYWSVLMIRAKRQPRNPRR